MNNWEPKEPTEQQKKMNKIVEIMRKELEKAHQKPTTNLSDSEVLVVHQYHFLNKLNEKILDDKIDSLKTRNNFLETLLIVQKNQIQNNQDIQKLIQEVKENNNKKSNNCSHSYSDKVNQEKEKWIKICLKEMRWMLVFMGFLGTLGCAIGIILSLKAK